jgi:ABC transporter, ATP-binding protein
MSRQKGATVIIVTHNGALAPIADRVIHMRDATVMNMTINEHPQDIDILEY